VSETTLTTEKVIEEAKRFMASKEFKDLSTQSRYAYFVQQSATAADGDVDDNHRLSTFRVVMNGFLNSSSWSITGSQCSLANVTSVLPPLLTGTADDILASTYQPPNTLRLYISATGLSNVE
jgi:hypothetical protein